MKEKGMKPRRCISSKDNEYELWKDFSREDADRVYEQTGYKIPIPPHEDSINNYKVGEGNSGTIRIALDKKKDVFVAVKKTKVIKVYGPTTKAIVEEEDWGEINRNETRTYTAREIKWITQHFTPFLLHGRRRQSALSCLLCVFSLSGFWNGSNADEKIDINQRS